MATQKQLDKSMTLGQRIGTLRRARGMSQLDLAAKIGIHNNHLSRIENDRFKPSPRTLVQIAEVLGVTPDELVEESELRETVTDPLLFRAFHNAQSLTDQDKKVLIHIINAFITRLKVEKAVQAQERCG